MTRADIERLRAAVERLEAAYERRRAEFADVIARSGERMAGAVPEDMRDSSGRSILLDSLVALVNGRAALVRAEQDRLG